MSIKIKRLYDNRATEYDSWEQVARDLLEGFGSSGTIEMIEERAKNNSEALGKLVGVLVDNNVIRPVDALRIFTFGATLETK